MLWHGLWPEVNHPWQPVQIHTVKGFWRSLYNTIKTNYAKLTLVIMGVTRLYNRISCQDGTEVCLKPFQGKRVSIPPKDTATVNLFTLTICTFTQNPTNYAQRSHDTILKEVNPPSTQFSHIHSYKPLTLLNLLQLHLLHTPPFSVSSIRCHSLPFALSSVP